MIKGDIGRISGEWDNGNKRHAKQKLELAEDGLENGKDNEVYTLTIVYQNVKETHSTGLKNTAYYLLQFN